MLNEAQQNRTLQTYALLAEQQDPSASSSGGAHLAVAQTLQDVVEFGRLPKGLENPATESEVAECQLANRVRKHHLGKRAQEMLEELKATNDTASRSSAPAPNAYPFTTSGDSHLAANPLHSVFSATIQEPASNTSQNADDNPFLARLKERQRTRAT